MKARNGRILNNVIKELSDLTKTRMVFWIKLKFEINEYSLENEPQRNSKNQNLVGHRPGVPFYTFGFIHTFIGSCGPGDLAVHLGDRRLEF